MKQVKYHQKFWEIRSHYFRMSLPDCTGCLRTEEQYKEVRYDWVEPVYVYSINKNYDGEETFDVSVVNMRKSKDGNWKCRFTVRYKEIGERVFRTERKAWEAYNKRFSKEQVEIYAKLREKELEQNNAKH